MQGIHNQRFECYACCVTLLPASCKREVNKKRPYFRLFEYTDHDKNCGAERAKKAKARVKSVTTEEGFPFPYPNKLVLEDDASGAPGTIRNIVCHPTGLGIVGGAEGKEGTPKSPKRHNHTTNTIRPLAQTYLDYPFDREYLQLDVPGVRGTNFEQVFRYLFYTETSSFSEYKIFYGSIRFSKIHVHEDFAEVELSEGKWEKLEGRNRLVRPQVVRINMKGWPELMRSSLLDELEVTRREIIEAHRKGDKKTKGWVFFLGRQDLGDKFLFHVNDHRLVCCLADVMVKTSKQAISTNQNIRNSPSVTAKAIQALHLPEVPSLKVEEPKKSNVFSGSVAPRAGSNHQSNTTSAVTQAPPLPKANPVKNFEVARGKELSLPHETVNAGVRSELAPKKGATTDIPSQDSHPHGTAFRKVKLWLRKLIGKS